jgi:hypothetical protein
MAHDFLGEWEARSADGSHGTVGANQVPTHYECPEQGLAVKMEVSEVRTW